MATSIGIQPLPPFVRMPMAKANNALQVTALDWPNGQVVAAGSSSASSGAFDANNDRVVEVSATTNCWITVGASPTAAAHTAGNSYLPSGQTRYVYAPAGAKIAVIQDSASGYISAVPALTQA